MNSDALDALAALLQEQSKFIHHEDVPPALLETDYLTEGRLPDSHTCPECGEQAFLVPADESDHDHTVVCDKVREHEFAYKEEELLRYDLQVDPLLSDVAETAGLTPIGSTIDQRPDFFAQQTTENAILCVLGSAKDYENAVHDAVQYIIEKRQPALLFTPRERVEELYELIEPYAVAGVIQPLSILALNEPAYIREVAQTVQYEQDRKESLFDEQDIGRDDLRWVLEDHPTLIKSKLSTLRTLREYSHHEQEGIGRTIWTEFEKVCKAAFGYLDFELKMGEGGVDDEGEEVADAIIGFPESDTISTVEGLSRLHGIVDAKSGGQAGFESEAVSKQLDYFDDLRADKLYEPYTFLHLFIVFDVDADEMVDWYEVAKPNYPDQTGMVVLTAQALRQMVDIMQSPAGKAALNRSERDTRDVFRYFFDPQLYTRPEFNTITQLPKLDAWGATEADSQSRYEAYNRLLFVTQEMVIEWVTQSLEKEHGTDTLFEANPPD